MALSAWIRACMDPREMPMQYSLCPFEEHLQSALLQRHCTAMEKLARLRKDSADLTEGPTQCHTRHHDAHLKFDKGHDARRARLRILQ